MAVEVSDHENGRFACNKETAKGLGFRILLRDLSACLGLYCCRTS